MKPKYTPEAQEQITRLLICHVRRDPGIRTETLKQLVYGKQLDEVILNARKNDFFVEVSVAKDFHRFALTNDLVVELLAKSGRVRPEINGLGCAVWYRWYPCKSKRLAKKAFEEARRELGKFFTELRADGRRWKKLAAATRAA